MIKMQESDLEQLCNLTKRGVFCPLIYYNKSIGIRIDQFFDKKEFYLVIRIMFVCHGRNCTFAWNALKSRLLGNENGICTPIVPLFCASVPRQPKSKAFGLEFVNRTVLDKNEYDLWWKKFLRGGEKCWQDALVQMDRFWKTLYQFSLQIDFVHRFMV